MKKDCCIAGGRCRKLLALGLILLLCSVIIVAVFTQKGFLTDNLVTEYTATDPVSEQPLVIAPQAENPTNRTFQIWSEHLPQGATYIGNPGVYLICTDSTEMQQGSRYVACTMENSELIPWENRTFSANFSVRGQSIHGEFEYGVRDGNIVITRAPAGRTDNTIRFFYDTSQGIHRVLVGVDIAFSDGRTLHYPVYLDLEKEEAIDFLAGIDQETLCEVFSNEIYPMIMVGEGKFLLGRQNDDSSYSYFYLDVDKQKIVDLEKRSGKKIADAILCSDEIICWDNTGEFWSLGLDKWEITQLTYASNVVFSSGAFHSANGESSSFFLYRDGEQALHLYDFLTREDLIVEEPDGWKFEARAFRIWGNGRMLCMPGGKNTYFNLDADTGSFQPIELPCSNAQYFHLWEKSASDELVFVSDDKTEYYFCVME